MKFFDALWNYSIGLLKQIGPLEWLLIFMLSFGLWVMWRGHAGDSPMNARHLVVDPATGHIVLEKFVMLGAFLISSWGFVALVYHKQLSEWYFIGYMAAWAATRSFTSWMRTKKGDTDVQAQPGPGSTPQKPA